MNCGLNPELQFKGAIHGAAADVQDFLTRDSGLPFLVCSRRRLLAAIGQVHDEAGVNPKLQRQRAMISGVVGRNTCVQDVNTICMRLFDTWCESRNLTPLAYLMHCWPLSDCRPHTIRRLQETMKDLRRNHADKLDPYALSVLGELASHLDELIDRAQTSTSHALADSQPRWSAGGEG